MREETFASEAFKCRDLALRYSGPERRLLINLAAAFEELARSSNGAHSQAGRFGAALW